MTDHDNTGDARSRDDNRLRLEKASRSRVVNGRWIPIHPFRATPSERIMFAIGCIILLAVIGAFAAPHFGLMAPFRTYAQLEAAAAAPGR